MDQLPVADPWFVVSKVSDGVHLVSEPHVHPLLRCNVWHVSGRDSDLVIDTSLGLAPLRHLVERELPGELLAVATHAHSDHVGGMWEFEHRAIHPFEATVLHEPITSYLDPAIYPESVVGPYRDAGYEFGARFVDAVPPGGLASSIVTTDAAPATRLLLEGDVVDTGDRSFEVLHLPGHSPGSIGLWEAATGILFSGDAVYDGPLLDGLDNSDILAYVATMRRLRELPVTAVHGGHERSFGRERLVELCDQFLARRA